MDRCKKLEENFFVSGQVSRESLEQAAALGITRLINNRPDFEEAGQPSHAQVRGWAAELGLEYYFVPVVPGSLSAETLEEFSRAIHFSAGDLHGPDNSPGKVLACCRSGARSCALWALDRASRRAIAVEDIIRAAKNAGYDISPMKDSLEHLARLPG